MEEHPLPHFEKYSVTPLTELGDMKALTQQVFSTKTKSKLVAMEDYFALIGGMLVSTYGERGSWFNRIHDFQVHRRTYRGDWVSIWLQLRELKQLKSRLFLARFVTEAIGCKDGKMLMSGDFTCTILLRRQIESPA